VLMLMVAGAQRGGCGLITFQFTPQDAPLAGCDGERRLPRGTNAMSDAVGFIYSTAGEGMLITTPIASISWDS
jgi:hypothetical protein